MLLILALKIFPPLLVAHVQEAEAGPCAGNNVITSRGEEGAGPCAGNNVITSR